MTKYIKGNWKPVAIDSNVFSGDMTDLIGIEECTDYDLNEFSSKKPQKRNLPNEENIPKKKRKNVNKERNKQHIEIDHFTPSKSGNTSGIEDEAESTKNDLDVTAWNSFGLPESILKALAELGYSNPTQIQELTLPSAILGRRDILGAAETGSGKTLAFGLPILTGILKVKEKHSVMEDEKEDESNSDESDFEDDIKEDTGCVKLINDVSMKETSKLKPLFALVLTPTRELAIQVKNHLVAVAKYTGVSVAVVVGGMAAVKQERILSKGPEIVVATPGRLWELIQQGNLHLSQIDSIRFLAIDETDRMLEKGHFQELHELLERINLDEKKLKQRQTFVFSATLTLIHALPNYLKNKSKLKKSKKVNEMTPTQKLQKIVEMLGMNNPKVVDISEGKGTSETLTECRITCNIDEKDYYLFYFIKRHPGRTLVFCNSIGCVKRLAALLNLLECNPLPLHASMQQRQRLKNLERFRDNDNGILVATDVAARGLDIPQIDHVLHYQTPRTSESYVHRSGRTARASRQGITILLMEPNELPNYLKLCKTLGKSEDLPTFPVQDNYLNAVKKRIDLARELDKFQLNVKKANSENGWLQKAAEDMDIIIDDVSRKYDSEEVHSQKKILETKKKHLASLLNTPIFPKGFYEKYPLFSKALPGYKEDNEHEKAVDLVKNIINQSSKEKSRTKNLFKPKKFNKDKPKGVGLSFKFNNKKDLNKGKKGMKKRK
ncbi:ATP-dependent RNA helicase ddx24 [Diabrotica virgifera virgifera]|uniref:RNA helicase n=1 Tax=Diabrotica virgifera virgifera TaxID=50390 RepID=A0ABM5KGB8_DIAVI|nr:ATP-dependent RNA helicase ddx24 [Diabrotica virgifera virgifera]